MLLLEDIISHVGTRVSLLFLELIVSFQSCTNVVWVILHLPAQLLCAKQGQVDSLTNWSEWVACISNEYDV